MPSTAEIQQLMAERKRRQEEEDRVLAQQLQDALEAEEAQRRAEDMRMAAELEKEGWKPEP